MKKIEVENYFKAQRLLNKIARKEGLRLAFQSTKTFQVIYAVDFNGNIPISLYRDKVLKRTFLFIF
jgi:hypothetical protein